MTTIPNIIPTTNPTKIITTIPAAIPTTIVQNLPTTIIPPIVTTVPNIPITTIPNEIPTTIITPNPETTIQNVIPTTVNIPTTIIENIPTTIPKIIQTTIKNIPTTILTTIINKMPTTNYIPETTIIEMKPSTQKKMILPSTLPEKIPSTIPKVTETTIPQIIVEDKCSYGIAVESNCSFTNLTDMQILEKVKADILSTYPRSKGKTLVFEDPEEFFIVMSQSMKELNNNNKRVSFIDLGDCETEILKHYGLTEEDSLIIIQTEKKTNITSEKDVQFELYHPITHEKIDLSLCEGIKANLYVPADLSEETQDLYRTASKQGYDPFDINDKFYREICTPYNSENGTDVLLDDREEYIYSSVVNETTCPNNCEYSAYSQDTRYIKCECDLNKTGLIRLDLKHLSADNAYNSLLSTLKNSNYKVMRCYNLVFNFKIFCHNYGSIIVLIFFIIYVLFMIYYCCKGISPLKVGISKILFYEQQRYYSVTDKQNLFLSNYVSLNTKMTKTQRSIKNKIKETKGGKGNFPPRKVKLKKIKNDSLDKNVKKSDGIKLIDIVKKSKNKKDKKIVNFNDKESVNSDKARKRRSLVDYMNENKDNKKDGIEIYIPNKDEKSEEKLKNQEKTIDKLNEEKKKNLDNFELNNLDYDEACELDNRSCCKTYFSVLLREHYVLFTFCSWNDYNLFYVKIERFFILICTEMTMNGLFFLHHTMRRKYVEGEELTFVDKIPQYIFSLIASHVVEVILCFLSMSDIHIYEIKALPKLEKNDERIFDILDKIRNRLRVFFVFTFLVFLFHWYFISAFCAVYQNTQLTFLEDSGISIATSLIDPFIIYGATTLLRYLSLIKCCRKKACCLYKVGDIIPIF